MCQNRTSLDLAHINQIEIGIGRCIRDTNGVLTECEGGSQDANVLYVDEITAVDLRPGATHRIPSTPPEHLANNAGMRAAIAAVMRDRQVLNGLAPAWYEETVANY